MKVTVTKTIIPGMLGMLLGKGATEITVTAETEEKYIGDVEGQTEATVAREMAEQLMESIPDGNANR